MKTDSQIVTYGTSAQATQLLGHGFRISPSDGCAAFPRVVQLDGIPEKVFDSGWFPTKARALAIQAAGPASTISTSVPSSEEWDIAIAEDPCELGSPIPPMPKGTQLLFSLNATKGPGEYLSPVIDARPFNGIRIVGLSDANARNFELNEVFSDGAFAERLVLAMTVPSAAATEVYLLRQMGAATTPTSGFLITNIYPDLFRLRLKGITLPSPWTVRVWGIRS